MFALVLYMLSWLAENVLVNGAGRHTLFAS